MHAENPQETLGCSRSQVAFDDVSSFVSESTTHDTPALSLDGVDIEVLLAFAR